MVCSARLGENTPGVLKNCARSQSHSKRLWHVRTHRNVPFMHYLLLSSIYIISSFLKVICFGLYNTGQNIKDMLISGNKTLRFMVTEVLNIANKL